MTTTALVALGIVLGALGAAGHLLVTRWRARQVLDGRAGRALATYPVGLLPVAAAVLIAAAVAPVAAWATPVGLIGVRAAVLRRGRAT